MKNRLTRIYTKTGDKGKTGLAGGQSVSKDSLRIETFGCVDELNSILGMARSVANESKMDSQVKENILLFLKRIQNELFVLGGDLATLKEDQPPEMVVIEAKHVEQLEKNIDEWQNDLEPLKEFILPGGGVLASWIHIARSVTRHSERLAVELSKIEVINPQILPYLNRLSDSLFVFARWITRKTDEDEIMWEK